MSILARLRDAMIVVWGLLGLVAVACRVLYERRRSEEMRRMFEAMSPEGDE